MKNNIIIALTGVCLFLVFFLVKCRKDPPPGKPVITVKTIVKQLSADSAKFQKKNDSMALLVKKLTVKVTNYKSDLNAAQVLVNELLNDAPETVYITDIQQAVSNSDSLCNTTIATQDSIINVKTDQADALLIFNSDMRKSIGSLIAVTVEKDAEIKYYKKQTRKHKAGKTFYKVIAITATVLAVKQSL